MQTICDLETIKKMGIVDKNLLNNVTEHVLYTVEKQVLMPHLTPHLYNQIITQKNNDNYLTQYKYIIDEFIIYAVAHRLKGELMVDQTFQLKRNGVAQNAQDKTAIINLKDVKELQRMCIETSDWWINQMVAYIQANSYLYPEYGVVLNSADEVPCRDKFKAPIVL